MNRSKHSHVNNAVTFGSLLVALGIIYGDIGTSPLYVMRAIIGERQVEEILVYGAVSAVFWTLIIQTTIKYVWVTLQADNQGEGGIFSLYALVRRYGKYLTYVAILGATTLLADGMITPPITVSSAIEGLNMVKGLENIIIPGNQITVTIVVIILSCLFFFQRFGTQLIGKAFGPIMFLWFSMLLVVGVNQILYHPNIIKALSPHYAIEMLTMYPKGFWLLGAVFLCTTGAEALYSDLGHCGIKNIRISWIYVKISLIACYLGQAAWLMNSNIKELGELNPFFAILPHWGLLPGIIIATMASIIASQALISGSYTLISEAMNLNFWPRVAVRQPTETKGQIYIPSINLILWIGCLFIVFYFRSSEYMEAAYGFFITLTMMMTTILLNSYLLHIKKWSRFYTTLIITMFAIVEISFFVANIIKLKQSWFVLFIALFLFAIMYVWYHARKLNIHFTKFVEIKKYFSLLTDLTVDDDIPKFSTHLIYLTKAKRKDEIEEKVIKSIFAKKPKRADIYWFLHITRTNQPYGLTYQVHELVDDTVIKVNISLGFRIQAKSEFYFKKIVQDLVKNKELNLHIRPDGSTKYNNEPDFKFVVIEKFLSIENEFSFREGLLLNTYFMLKRFSQSDQDAFGLDKSDVAIEQIPLVYHPIEKVDLIREMK